MTNTIADHIGWIKSKMIYEWFPFKSRRKRIFYKEIIQPGDLCFDIGAHLGDRARTFLDLGAAVVAVEPQPKFVQYLKSKFKSENKFHIEGCAVSENTKVTTLSISSRNPTLSTLSGHAWKEDMNNATSATIIFDKQIKVPTTTLDLLSKKYGLANFIKIDVEGYELQVLNGLSYQPNYISIEFLSFDLDQLKLSLDRLQELGYTSFNWSYKETFQWQNGKWKPSDEILNQISNYREGVFSGDVYAKV